MVLRILMHMFFSFYWNEFICYCLIECKAAQLEAAEVQKTKLERENLHLAQEMEKYSEIQVIRYIE